MGFPGKHPILAAPHFDFRKWHLQVVKDQIHCGIVVGERERPCQLAATLGSPFDSVEFHFDVLRQEKRAKRRLVDRKSAVPAGTPFKSILF
jgi:hypothetical protein